MSIVVLLSGSGTNLQAIMDAGHPFTGENKINIKFVMSDKHDAYGLKRAQKRKIPTLSQPKLKLLEKNVTKLCKANNVELIVLAGFMRLLNPDFVKKWKGKIINIHPSLLPSFKGANAVEQAYNYGVKYTGVTVHYVDEGMDTGSIIAQEVVTINKFNSLNDLYAKIHEVEHRLYPNVIRELLKGK
jgi:phosphoribosylglycinamide formyltransferase-1|tara:strand:+ start:703 stop:1260 length:558 start_codon:yes stop_codon:yes gene_type:complete